MKILIVEDDTVSRILLEQLARSRGHEVISFGDVASAWDAYRNEPYPLVLLDWMLGGSDGLELCRRMRALPHGERSVILVVTVRDQPEHLEAVIAAGADDYVAKPINLDLLNVRLAIAEHQARMILERKRAENALRESHELLQSTLDALSAHIAILDARGTIIGVNEAWRRAEDGNEFLGSHQGVGGNYLEACESICPEYPEINRAIIAGIREVISNERDEFYLEYPCHADAQKQWFTVRATRFQGAESARVVVAQEDITGRKLAEEKLRHFALHDPLTGLPNRALFLDRLNETFARAHEEKGFLFAVLFLDLDRFKFINDEYGHLVGDQLLVAAAQRLKACLRPEDTVARFGGDEFTILLTEVEDPKEAEIIAARIEHELTLPFTLGGNHISTTLSIGIALSTSGHVRPETLLHHADTAMYQAKALRATGTDK